ncbi:hypothetical protein [Carboxylicivirga caseinilyticus]|uniref:hypothetical protein n=1 Tax=Carboxylicivirga caseinilyticus TaxID=3417572 RepID=UPI003D330F1C|nr:hypothetical protein [Marinilabiliaceae bacterium A049]
MKLKSLILFGLLFSIGVLKAQTDYRQGFILTHTGDTIYGEIDYRSDLLMSSLCRFKDRENAIKEYSPDDITAYRFVDGKYYIVKEINNEKVFLEFLIKGEINMYYMRDKIGDHYYLDKVDVPLIELPYEEGTKYLNGEEVSFETTKHIGILKYYMQDAPGFQSRINSIKRPEHKNLIKLAEDYHKAVCDGEQCIIYEKSTPLINILPEFIVGVSRYTNFDAFNDKLYMHTGLIGHIWMPSTSEKMYFRTGVLFSQLEYYGQKKNYYKIPCQIEYIYPQGIFRPRVSYGLNFYIPGYQSVSLDIGANIKLSETFFLSATADIEFDPSVIIVPNSMICHSFNLGLFVKF